MDLGEEDAEENRDAGDTESGSIEEDRCVSSALRPGPACRLRAPELPWVRGTEGPGLLGLEASAPLPQERGSELGGAELLSAMLPPLCASCSASSCLSAAAEQ